MAYIEIWEVPELYQVILELQKELELSENSTIGEEEGSGANGLRTLFVGKIKGGEPPKVREPLQVVPQGGLGAHLCDVGLFDLSLVQSDVPRTWEFN